VTSRDAVLAFVAEVEAALGSVDILVNNAGLPAGMTHGRFHEVTLAE
jgi:NAD(P)-dependent dehydrogenase (short-subunit alcohol dehydrogenase family)